MFQASSRSPFCDRCERLAAGGNQYISSFVGGGTYEAGSLLDQMDPVAARRLLDRGTTRRVRKGSMLFAEGDRSDRVFLLISGRVRVFRSDESGRESLLAIRGPGDLLGELSAIDDDPRSASAVALEEVEVTILSGADFRDALDTVPGLARILLATVVARLRDADRKRAEFGSADATRRVARRLVELADRYGEQDGGAITVALAITQDDLAGWTGASREAVSRAVRELRRSGLIETGRRSVTVLDLAGLSRRCA
jgi:CRP/FNR family cyclic AMP-dependent transcriptional regulator